MSFVAKDMSGIVAAQTNLNQLVGVFSNVGEGIARNVGAIDAAVATAGVSLGILSTQAARAYGEFERGQAIVQTVSGSTNAEMQILGQEKTSTRALKTNKPHTAPQDHTSKQ